MARVCETAFGVAAGSLGNKFPKLPHRLPTLDDIVKANPSSPKGGRLFLIGRILILGRAGFLSCGLWRLFHLWAGLWLEGHNRRLGCRCRIGCTLVSGFCKVLCQCQTKATIAHCQTALGRVLLKYHPFGVTFFQHGRDFGQYGGKLQA